MPANGCGPWVPLHSGRKLYLLDPRPEDIDIHDIAVGLSRECRFSNHTQHFYSVAQHSTIVSTCCPPRYALAGLLHDAAEGLGLRDLCRPFKRLPGMETYNNIESHVLAAVFDRYNIVALLPLPAEVGDANMLVYATECRDLFPQPLPDADWAAEVAGLPKLATRIWPAPEEAALSMFLRRFKELVK